MCIGKAREITLDMERVNCDKELFAAEGGVTERHAVFLRP
jgi:hypothetical protein